MYAGSPDLAASYQFVKFLNSAESQAHVATENNTLPTRASVYDMPEVTKNEIIAEFQAPLEGAVPQPAAPGAGDLYDTFTPFYEKIMGGQASVAKGLSEAQQKAKGAIPGFES